MIHLSCSTMRSYVPTDQFSEERIMVFPSQPETATDWKHAEDSCLDRKASPCVELSSNGWVVGSFVNALRQVPSPQSTPKWQIQPALLIGIHKDELNNTNFTVVFLYDQKAAAEGLSVLGIYARYRAMISLWTWPREHMYVMGSHMENLRQWDLRTWSRSKDPSISDRWSLDSNSNRLVRCDIALRKAVQRALSHSPRFLYFHRLPREVRDRIYDYLLFDKQQRTIRSRIYISSLLSIQAHRKNGWPQYSDSFRMPQVPRFQTPCILRVCKWVRLEALEALYRTKILVITVSHSKNGFWSFDENCVPDVRYFRRIRVDITVGQEAVHVMSECFRYVATLLSEQQTHSLRFLELRLGFLHSRAPAANTGDSYMLEMSTEAVSGLMSRIQPVLKERSDGRTSAVHQPIQISWGVSKTHIEDGDFDCYCSYLSPEFLQKSLEQSDSGGDSPHTDAQPDIALQNCQLFGCIYHAHTS